MSIFQIITGTILVLVLMWFGLNSVLRHGFLPRKQKQVMGVQLPLVVRICRMYSGAIMMVLGVMLLIGLVYLETPAQDLADQSDIAVAQGVPVQFTPEQKSFAATYAWFWLSFLTVLFSMVVASSIDVVCSWRYSRKHRKNPIRHVVCEETASVHVAVADPPKRQPDYWCENFFHHN